MADKFCRKCKTWKPGNTSHFRVNNDLKDKLSFYCKLCLMKENNKYYSNNKKKFNAYYREYWNKNKFIRGPMNKEYSRQRYRELRKEVFDGLGGETPSCVCCGESELLFLSIDHKNGGGREHRKNLSSIKYLESILGDLSKYQLLCHNCNMTKGLYGQCPHKMEVKI